MAFTWIPKNTRRRGPSKTARHLKKKKKNALRHERHIRVLRKLEGREYEKRIEETREGAGEDGTVD